MKIGQFLLNYVSLFALVLLTVDALVANWTFNPVWDLLYARVQLNLFQNTHAVSILAVCLSAYWMAFKMKDGIPIAVFAAFGTASIHELSLDAVDISIFHIDSGIDLRYGLYLFAFLAIGFFISKRYHRKVWATQAIVLVSWFLVLTALPHGSTIDPNVPFGASKDFYTWWVNLEEVASWLAPVALWFLPRRWFQWKSR